MNHSHGHLPMDTTLKSQLAHLCAEWDKAPMTTKLIAGAYMDPLLNLLKSIINAMEPTNGNSQD